MLPETFFYNDLKSYSSDTKYVLSKEEKKKHFLDYYKYTVKLGILYCVVRYLL